MKGRGEKRKEGTEEEVKEKKGKRQTNTKLVIQEMKTRRAIGMEKGRKRRRKVN